MRKENIKFLLVGLFLFIQLSVAAQSEATHEQHHLKGSHRVTLGLGHTHVSEGKVDNKTEWIVAPSWSLNYDYWLGNKWAIGLQTDLLLESFKIENEHGEEIERSKPLSVVPVVIFKPGKHISFLAGIGEEFSSEKNLTLVRLGMECGWHLPKNWELGAAAVWDNKWNYYNSWALVFTISKIYKKDRKNEEL